MQKCRNFFAEMDFFLYLCRLLFFVVVAIAVYHEKNEMYLYFPPDLFSHDGSVSKARYGSV